MRQASIAFSAGAFGGLVNSLTVWLFGLIGITPLFGVKIAPALTPAWLYPRLVWGGLWGLLFLLPIHYLIRKPLWFYGLLFSLLPSLVQLLLVFPVKDSKGLFGLALGGLTPLFVLLFNAVWGIATAFWLHLSDRKIVE
ncbi:MAG TPA: hypothetical protein IGS53_17275 [Leptolyngbyaceae cyanobacterium M33_DOE_097]|uniref:Uncharacterized protein n=1 Tax=Oscillatoriales cyanobacterium SpSt-418 TaxID=2282169 RepID=A0A7C3PG93_9CYAN|nr:hypothetical protein [Leptolyngbyaceae cyanobacterium M33_DOE_097]